MKEIFSYSSLKVSLNSNTKSLMVFLSRETLDFETLFELESLLCWASGHIEIKSLLFSSKNDCFSKGISAETLMSFDQEKALKFYTKLSKILLAISCLPQTTIVDLKGGAENLGIELALAADLIISKKETILKFNHLELGIPPVWGSCHTLQSKFGAQFLKNAFLAGKEVNYLDLKAIGAISDSTVIQILKNINKQSSIARIQTKALLNTSLIKNHEEISEIEQAYIKGTLATEEWQNGGKFTNARDFKRSKEAGSDVQQGPENLV